MLDPRWNTFLVLCETMNYTRAAERLCLTQPAVTHHIHYLEDHYGCRLFSYEGKVLRLTEAGVKLREYTRSLAYNSRKVEESMMAPKPLSLRIGASKTIGEFVVAPKVERFLRDYPEASFSLIVDNTQVLLRMLEAGSWTLCWWKAFLMVAGMKLLYIGKRSFSASARRGIGLQAGPYP